MDKKQKEVVGLLLFAFVFLWFFLLFSLSVVSLCHKIKMLLIDNMLIIPLFLYFKYVCNVCVGAKC